MLTEETLPLHGQNPAAVPCPLSACRWSESHRECEIFTNEMAELLSVLGKWAEAVHEVVALMLFPGPGYGFLPNRFTPDHLARNMLIVQSQSVPKRDQATLSPLEDLEGVCFTAREGQLKKLIAPQCQMCTHGDLSENRSPTDYSIFFSLDHHSPQYHGYIQGNYIISYPCIIFR